MTTTFEQEMGTARAEGDRPSAPPLPRYGGVPRKTGAAARTLGWFSIGLGLAEVAMPRRMARLAGMDDDTYRGILFAYGLREIATGVAILATERSAGAVWARVGGDVMDLATLGRAMADDDSDRGRLTAAAAAVLGVTALDLLTSRRLSRNGQSARRAAAKGIVVSEAVTIAKPREEVYRFWRDFTNLPRFMEHLEAVQVQSERRSHWRARAPAGSTVEWDAEIIEDEPNSRISWRSIQNADVPNTGTVRFRTAPGNRGTEIHVELRYEAPAGKLGALVAKLFGEEPGQQVKGDLHRLKQVLETGEVVHSDASVHPGLHPAQPSERPSTGRTQR
ncbi:MAG TPA: SRPBCC family protein [Gemmatimonadales bacterium]|nr:SRPBCC family protein [Gemmatimonadales bacterium]